MYYGISAHRWEKRSSRTTCWSTQRWPSKFPLVDFHEPIMKKLRKSRPTTVVEHWSDKLVDLIHHNRPPWPTIGNWADHPWISPPCSLVQFTCRTRNLKIKLRTEKKIGGSQQYGQSAVSSDPALCYFHGCHPSSSLISKGGSRHKEGRDFAVRYHWQTHTVGKENRISCLHT